MFISNRQKALIALSFAGAVLGPMATQSTASEPPDSVIVEIAKDKNESPQERAYRLLSLAESYLAGRENLAEIARLYKPQEKKIVYGGRFTFEVMVNSWVMGPRLSPKKKSSFSNIDLAAKSIETAMTQLPRVPATVSDFELYYMASKLARETERKKDIDEINRIIGVGIKACEENPWPSEQQVEGASKVLNLMADEILSVRLPGSAVSGKLWVKPASIPAFSSEDFKRAENLRLRAVSLANRLNNGSNQKRRLHRDLAFWYLQLGKTELAEKQKQIVFELTGYHDDRIMYPISQMCGSEIWWEDPAKPHAMFLCGMG